MFGFHYQVAQTDVSSRGLVQKGNSRSSNQGRSKAQSSALPSAHLLSQVECLGCKANRRQQPARLLRQTHLSLLKFPYVCPEPVLVKWSFSACFNTNFHQFSACFNTNFQFSIGVKWRERCVLRTSATSSSLRPTIVPNSSRCSIAESPSYKISCCCEKRICFEISLCLSRACLGK